MYRSKFHLKTSKIRRNYRQFQTKIRYAVKLNAANCCNSYSKVINVVICVTFVQRCNDINDTRSGLQAVNLLLNLVIRKKALLAQFLRSRRAFPEIITVSTIIRSLVGIAMISLVNDKPFGIRIIINCKL